MIKRLGQKRYVSFIIAAVIIAAMAIGCGKQGNLESVEAVAKEAVLKEAVSEETASEGITSETAEVPPSEGATDIGTESIINGKTQDDNYIDLTLMSGTMVYSQVYNMVFYPENFIGTRVKMEGLYSEYMDMATGNRYFGCIIMDATACCAQGIEFNPTDEYKYPDDYPEDGDHVTVEGVFDVYEEDGAQYCTLRNARIIDTVAKD